MSTRRATEGGCLVTTDSVGPWTLVVPNPMNVPEWSEVTRTVFSENSFSGPTTGPRGRKFILGTQGPSSVVLNTFLKSEDFSSSVLKVTPNHGETSFSVHSVRVTNTSTFVVGFRLTGIPEGPLKT